MNQTPEIPFPAHPKPSEALLITCTKAAVEAYMSHPRFDASHDYTHVQRVLSLAEHILSVERTSNPSQSYNTTVVILAALLHDVQDRKYLVAPTTGGDFVTKTDSTKVVTGAEEMLLGLDCPRNLASTVQAIVDCVSYTKECRDPQLVHDTLQSHPELGIVQDADRLDAIGAVGIARAFTYGGAKSSERGLEGTLLHFDEKLLGLEHMMKTGEGKRLARMRTRRLEHFKQWWDDETTLDGGKRCSAVEGI